MKKLVAVALICCMTLSMTACQGKTDDTPTDSIADTSSVSVPEERDETPEGGQPADETSIQEQDSQPSSETPVQQSDNNDSIVYMTTDISPEGRVFE